MRGSDSINYSRFIGFWNRPSVCTVMYHFGNKNMLMKSNGEMNARQAAKEFANKDIDSLILGDSMETLRSILDYSVWFNQKPKSQRQYIRKLLFHIDLTCGHDNDVAFLPVCRAIMPVIRMMAATNWSDIIKAIQKAYLNDGLAVWSLLDCTIQPWVLNLILPKITSCNKVLILCYDWQEALVREYFQEITDQKEIWIQVLASQVAENFFFGRTNTLPYAPIRL